MNNRQGLPVRSPKARSQKQANPQTPQNTQHLLPTNQNQNPSFKKKPRPVRAKSPLGKKKQLIFVSKKDNQMYTVHDIVDKEGNPKKMLVNMRDRSVKMLKTTSSVRSITSLQSGRVSQNQRRLKSRNKAPALYGRG